jgi:uncharacterized protein
MRIEQTMPEQIGRWDELEQALLELGDQAMVLEELDGFIAGVLVCPETIPPGEWFARAVGLSRSKPSPFTDLDHANDVLGLVMVYYDDVARTLERQPERYQPRFPVDEQNGDVIWELWIDGFAAATNLRREAFESYLDAGVEIEIAAVGKTIMISAALDEDPGPLDYASLNDSAPETIRASVVTLHRYRQATRPATGSIADQPNPFASARKVGRNDPCPCGSGKKYKRCCGGAN